MMLDIHSHFLPKMDDGSKSAEMSVEMLRASAAQGVTTIVSTSHFYADSESPKSFLGRRRHAFHKIEPLLTPSDPEIILGTEVMYYPGISHSDEIPSLAIRGTDLILIEMPFIPWSDGIFDELISFQYTYNLHIVLAHVERYQAIQKRAVFEELFEQPFYFQCNAEAFSFMRSRKLAIEMMKNDLLHFIGTDCHNNDKRPPNMQTAQQMISKKLSPDAWQKLITDSEELFNKHRV